MMFKEMWDYMPTWVKIVFVVWFLLAIGGTTYTINKCGFAEAMMLGNGGMYAAMMGMCND